MKKLLLICIIYSIFSFQQASAFSYLISGDTQFYWSIQDAGGDEMTEGIKSNTDQINAMNNMTNMTATLEQPNLVLLLGDLTAYAHDYQWDVFLEMYIAGTRTKRDTQLKLPVFWGLGNHDYANNTPLSPGQGCMTANNAFLGYHGCARRSLKRLHEFAKSHASHRYSTYGFIPSIINKDTHDAYNLVGGKSSWAYSWNQKNYHFVQLNNYPTYVNGGIDVTSAVKWLKADLNTFRNYKIVLLMHDAVEHWNIDDPEFVDAIRGHNVVAIFSAHIHSALGLYGYHTSSGHPIPMFFSGSSPWNTFLHVRFDPNQFTVTEMSSLGGTPQIIANQVFQS